MLINKKQSTAVNTYGLWRLVYILVFALLVFGVMLTGYFIYKTIYINIANANTTVATGLTANTYSLDISSFEKSLAATAQKKQLAPFPNSTRNIFDYSRPSTSPYATSSTPQ